MPRTAFILVAVLTLLTGLLLGQLRHFAGSRSVAVPAHPDPAASSLTAESFYAALNDVIRTGDGAFLESLVAPDFVDHSGFGSESGSLSSLQRYFQSLHERAPRSTLLVSDVTGEGALVAVRLRLQGGDALSAAGLPLRGSTADGFELLRIENDMIRERWASPALPPLVESLGSLVLESIPVWVREPRLELITLAPDAVLSVDDHEGTLLRVATGEVSIQLLPSSSAVAAVHSVDDHEGTLLRVATGEVSIQLLPSSAGAAETGSTEPALAMPAEFPVLQTGDTQAFDAHTGFRMRNDGQEPASVLWLSIVRANTYHYASTQGASQTPTPGIERVLLAGGVSIRPEQGPFRVVVDRVVDAVDLSVPVHDAGEFELLLVESGSVSVQAHTGYVLGVSSLGGLRVESGSVQVDANEGVAIPLAADLDYAVTGPEPATFWIVTVTAA